MLLFVCDSVLPTADPKRDNVCMKLINFSFHVGWFIFLTEISTGCMSELPNDEAQSVVVKDPVRTAQ
jgi:hypothetical protein